MKRTNFRIFVFLTIPAAVACHRAAEPEPEHREQPAESAEAPSLPPPQLLAPPSERPAAAAALAWKDPPGWTRVPSTSSMRLATYRVPKTAPDTDDGELTVFHFGPDQGGDVESNFSRWEKQFSDMKKPSKRTDRSVNGMSAHVIEIEDGTFQQSPMMAMGAPSGPKTHYGLLAAIVQAPDGAYFFKLTAPMKTLAASEKGFFDLIDSARPSS